MFCNRCGLELDPDSNFCPNCGTAVNKTTRPETPHSHTMGYWNEESENGNSGTVSRSVEPGSNTRGFWDEESIYMPPQSSGTAIPDNHHSDVSDQPNPAATSIPRSDSPESLPKEEFPGNKPNLSKADLRLQVLTVGKLKFLLGCCIFGIFLFLFFATVIGSFVAKEDGVGGAIFICFGLLGVAFTSFGTVKAIKAIQIRKRLDKKIHAEQQHCICPLCSGTGEIWRFYPAKGRNTGSYYTHSHQCVACNGTRWLEKSNADAIRMQLHPFKNQAVHEHCEFCGGMGAVVFHDRLDQLFACPACNGKTVLKRDPKKKKKIVSLLLCIPFGFFIGAHCFYEGRIKRALAELLLCIGMVAIQDFNKDLTAMLYLIFLGLWITDLIMIIRKKSEYMVYQGKYID